MVGNSVRSDILPVLEIGGSAVHVPYHLLWDHEHVADHGEEFSELASLADLPDGCVGQPERRAADRRRRDGQSLRSSTSRTRWSADLWRISDARSRVGRMFSRRLTPLIDVQIDARGLDRLLVGEMRQSA